MKTKSRKRLLISSVAMLLVAMLALGTATFAWFTQNTSATADGIYVKTSKASTLKISKNDKSWTNHVTYTQGTSDAQKIMIPASSGDGSAWFTANAVEPEYNADGTVKKESNGSYRAGTATSVQPKESNADYVLKNQLNVKNDGENGSAAIKDITISITLPENASDYARVALVPCNAEGKDLTTPDFTGQKIGFTNCVYDNKGETYPGVKSISGTGETQTIETQTITANSTLTVDCGTLTGQQARYYNLYVWFEGQDAECMDANAGQTLKGLSFEVTGTPAE